MEGYVKIYHGDLRDSNLIFEDHNLVVDAASEFIADAFTVLPSPSSMAPHISFSTSTMGIVAMSLGSAQSSKSYNTEGVAGIKALAPSIPVPTDTTIQPPVYDLNSSGPGRLGQFLNYINFSGQYSPLTLKEIKDYGCYIPSGGIYATSGNAVTHTWLDIDTNFGRGLAVKSDGTLHGWVKYQQHPLEYILINIPTDSHFTTAKLGRNHGVALTQQGHIVTWGDDTYNQVSNTPSGSGFTKISTNESHALALDSSGYIHAWGDYQFTGGFSAKPDTSGFTDINCGRYNNLAIDGSGYIHVWGNDFDNDVFKNVPDTSGYVQVAAGDTHCLALSGNGTLTSWGTDTDGTVSSTPAGTFSSISVGSFHSLALSSTNVISAWGTDSSYLHITNKPVAAVSSIAAGSDFNLTTSGADGDYQISGWGNDTYTGITGAPASGTPPTTHKYTGNLNDTSAINSEGFILESRVARGSQVVNDASAGFIVSGVGDVSSTREVQYTLTINYDEWLYLTEFYGGIGSIGLWTLNRGETISKHPEGTTMDEIDLYNIWDVDLNPVFRLFAKKVFLPGGLQLVDSAKDAALTIIWSIKF